jgi:anhydro-N-acetylmuramic acid kinase
MSTLYIGVMSGTSLDGVDAVLADFSSGCRVLEHQALPLPAPLKQTLLELNTAGFNELHQAALAANALVKVYAQAIHMLLDKQSLSPSLVRAVGSHGQTVRHQPGNYDGVGYTLQLNNPSLLAELCSIPVVADFRSRDVAAGGQGAPLVPAFHQYLWGGVEDETTVILNLGGMANLTVLGDKNNVMGFDCGPGNVLLDMWCQQHKGTAFDAHGAWSASGKPSENLIEALLTEPFFALPPPKSTGRDLFHRDWLDAHLQQFGSLSTEDVQASLAHLSARSAAQAIHRFAPLASRIFVCGGGAYNQHLMSLLGFYLPKATVSSTESHGLPPLQVEAAAFAWLAKQSIEGLGGNLPHVTGAKGLRVLGGIYPA